jgi:hypothetical protein
MLKINFSTRSDAFYPNARMEIACVLRGIVAEIDEGKSEGACVDSNGNSVGQWLYRPNPERTKAPPRKR